MRKRLLEAALEIMDVEGAAALTTTNVTRRAGLAQSSFYTHFQNLDGLLHALAEDANALNLKETRSARRSAPGNGLEALRETYRTPLQFMLAHPRLTRLMIASRYDPASALAEWSRENWVRWREALIEDLSGVGLRTDTPRRRRRAEMIAESIMAQSEVMALGAFEGRYGDLEEMVDVCVMFAMGYLGALGLWPATADHATGGRPTRARGGSKAGGPETDCAGSSPPPRPRRTGRTTPAGER